MKFSSVRDFFLKLHNSLYLMIIIPVVLFAYGYLEAQADMAQEGPQLDWLSGMLAILFVAGLILTYRWFVRRLKVVRETGSLVEKMTNYGRAVRFTYFIASVLSLLICAGYYWSQHPLFIALFVFSMIALSISWPSAGKLCKDLRLASEERNIVLHNKPIDEDGMLKDNSEAERVE